MAAKPNDEIRAARERLLEGMTEYMKDVNAEAEEGEESTCSYTQEHIDRCAALVDGYLSKVSAETKPAEKDVRAAVKEVVQGLNALNDECKSGLIETDQREDLCELINAAARAAGLKADEDLTEQWREW